jgi:hypothetical protein
MPCNLTTTTTKCVPCVHPLDYLFEFVQLGLANKGNTSSFNHALNTVLDKGIVQPNCKLCCPDCNGLYAFASVETMLELYEAVGLIQSAAVPASPLGAVNTSDFEGCCSNIFASLETYINYAENVGIVDSPAVPAGPLSAVETTTNPTVNTCCNGFQECAEEFICWSTQNVKNQQEVIDRFLDKGVVEFGNIVNNCTGASESSICKLTELLNESILADKNANKYAKEAVVDLILEKGIVVYCDPNSGEIAIASVETFLKLYEAVGDGGGGPVPAIGNS